MRTYLNKSSKKGEFSMYVKHIKNRIDELRKEGFTRSEAIELLKMESLDNLTNEISWLNQCVKRDSHEGDYYININRDVYTCNKGEEK